MHAATLPSLLISITLVAVAACADPLTSTVQTDTGPIRGAAVTSDANVLVFKGIPYAAPPVDALRWKPPIRIETWSGVHPANAFGPTCMQDPPPPGSFYRREFFREIEPMSEDCLYLNVWTAAQSPDDKRPVMMWIHGGAFRQGSGSTPSFGGETLAEKGVVLVTINYRLGVFGLLAHPELTEEAEDGTSGNYGLLDQIAALEWIQRNISAFGGDPGNVTIFGQSSGAASVNTLMASPLTEGLFHRAILQSGSAFAFGPTPTLAEAEEEGLAFASAVNSTSLRDLRALPADTVHAAGRRFGFSPNVDGRLLADDVQTIFHEGRQARVPVLAGSTADEGTAIFGNGMNADRYNEEARRRYGDRADAFLELYPAASEEEAGRMLNAGFSDRMAWGAHTLARLHTKDGEADAFVYYFSRIPPGHESDRYGAFHSADLVYVFDTLDAVERPWEAADRQLADQMSSMWVNFADGGDPNGAGVPSWPTYDLSTRQVLDFGDTLQTRVILDESVAEFYDQEIDAR